MDNVTLKNITESCKKELSALAIGSGLEQLKIIARYCSDSQILSQVEEIEENYHSMLSFLAGGGQDEDRSLTQNRISLKSQKMLRIAHRDIRLQEINNKYTKAFRELQSLYGFEPEKELLEKWGTNLMPDEQLLIQDHLFSLIWTSPLWTQKQTAHWYEFLSRQTELVKIHLMGAVILSLWEYFDTEKMGFLFLYTDTESEKLNALTITALVLLAEKYQQELTVCPELLKRYTESNVGKYTATVVKERLLMHRTLIAIKEEQELIAEFSLNMSSEELKKLMNKKFAHIRYMIENGLDANLSNRTELWYRCDFLRENISHWWFPFEKSSPVISELLLDKEGKFNKQAYHLLDLPSECDIDRYAMYSFMAKTRYKNDMMEKLAHSLDMADLSDEDLMVPYVNHLKTTMQNLYRIFVHSPLKNEIDNPFSWPYNFWQNSIIQDFISEEKAMELCLEMTNAQIYDQPVAWLDKLSETSGSSQVMLQLKSKCLYLMEEYPKAIATLTQLLFLDENDEYALSMIQLCFEKIGRKDKQLEYIQKLLALKPDEVSYLATAAVILDEMGKYDQALEHLFHLDVLDPDNPRFMESIEMCALHLRKFDIALRYNKAILENTNYKDYFFEYLNAGHIHFVMGDWKEALNNYRRFKEEVELKNKKRKQSIDPDEEFILSAKILEEMGISPSDIQLMRDMIQL